jgi:hypothetical protein
VGYFHSGDNKGVKGLPIGIAPWCDHPLGQPTWRADITNTLKIMGYSAKIHGFLCVTTNTPDGGNIYNSSHNLVDDTARGILDQCYLTLARGHAFFRMYPYQLLNGHRDVSMDRDILTNPTSITELGRAHLTACGICHDRVQRSLWRLQDLPVQLSVGRTIIKDVPKGPITLGIWIRRVWPEPYMYRGVRYTRYFHHIEWRGDKSLREYRDLLRRMGDMDALV